MQWELTQCWGLRLLLSGSQVPPSQMWPCYEPLDLCWSEAEYLERREAEHPLTQVEGLQAQNHRR